MVHNSMDECEKTPHTIISNITEVHPVLLEIRNDDVYARSAELSQCFSMSANTLT